MKDSYRSIWISDVHLCTRDCQADQLYNFLSSIKCDFLYLVGDIIDIEVLRKRWWWPPFYNEVVHKLLKRARKGAKVVFLPGNHDDFFRSFVGHQFGEIEIRDRVIHTTADGRRFLVIHGDVFDGVVMSHKWLNHLGTWAYGHVTLLNRLLNHVRAWLGLPYWSMSGAIKRKVKHAVTYVNNFADTLVDEAKREGVDGVICGHVHRPAMHDLRGFLYCNCGDWVENCTAVVEHEDGELEVLWWGRQEEAQRHRATQGEVDVPARPVDTKDESHEPVYAR